ncbi:MAG: MazG family protein [Oscillospiraceae bacterium]
MVNFQYMDSLEWRTCCISWNCSVHEEVPWDREQTHSSIRRNFLEETYEVLDAIDHDDASGMCEELGDVLMQVAFHAQIEAERGRFTMANVVDGVARKLVYRHPHVFGDVQADTSQQVLANWDVLKRREKGQRSTADAVEAVPHTLPALWRAERFSPRPPRPALTGQALSRHWTSWKRRSGSSGPPWRPVRPPTRPRHPGGAGRHAVYGRQNRPDVRAWTRRTPSTGPATSLTAASARWKRPRTSLCRSAVRRSCWPSGTMQNPRSVLIAGAPACVRNKSSSKRITHCIGG